MYWWMWVISHSATLLQSKASHNDIKQYEALPVFASSAIYMDPYRHAFKSVGMPIKMPRDPYSNVCGVPWDPCLNVFGKQLRILIKSMGSV